MHREHKFEPDRLLTGLAMRPKEPSALSRLLEYAFW
jgi:hypothetical protein